MSRHEYRVTWNRVGCSVKSKIYATRAGAERFMTLLGPQPWLACGYKSADEYVCCSDPHREYSDDECGCGGETIGESLAAKYKDAPPVENVSLEVRECGLWEPSVYALMGDVAGFRV